MALPTGIVTRTLTVSPETGHSRKASLEVLIDPSVDVVVWTATQEPIMNEFRVVRTTPDQTAVLNLPAVDQPGLVDKDLNPISNWNYKITVRYLVDGRKIGKTVVKYFKPTLATNSVTDFDAIPTGDAPLYVGPAGPAGLSAYDVAVKNGFVGSEEAWLASLATGGVTPFFEYHQTSPSNEWIIRHNLGFYPGGISLVDSSRREFRAEVNHIDHNTLRIKMEYAMSGSAFIS